MKAKAMSIQAAILTAALVNIGAMTAQTAQASTAGLDIATAGNLTLGGVLLFILWRFFEFHKEERRDSSKQVSALRGEVAALREELIRNTEVQRQNSKKLDHIDAKMERLMEEVLK